MAGNNDALSPGQRVLVTGHRGLVGEEVTAALRGIGLTVVGLDLADHDNITDPALVRSRIQDCAGVVHLAAVDDEPAHPDLLTPATTGDIKRVLATNVGGTSRVLAAAAQSGVHPACVHVQRRCSWLLHGSGSPTLSSDRR